jgi:uridine kinase
MEFEPQIVSTIQNLPKPTIVGMSGFGGSGKSTLAKKLGQVLNAPVIGVDSFQRKGAFDTEFSLWEIMDYSRLKKEVLESFLKKEDIHYGHFDPGKEIISNTVDIENKGILIVEGVGLFRPELMKYFTYKIWIDVPINEAILRGKRRDREEYGNPTDELWDGVWKENDIEYFSLFKPSERADLVISN